MKAPVIHIPSPSDKTHGFLNISSSHSFNLDNKTWPTVEHYILAKQFEGSTLEEDIRQAKSVLTARNLARPRSSVVPRDDNSGVVKRIVYGPDGSVLCSGRDASVQKQHLVDAIAAKFSQNPKILNKLKQTEGIEIVDLKNPNVGDIIVKFRDELLEGGERSNEVANETFQMSSPGSDTVGASGLTDEEKSLVSGIIKILEWVVRLENVSKVHTEMLEDVLYNITGAKVAKFLNPPLVLWSSDISDRWGTVVKDMPKFSKIFDEILIMLAAKFSPKILTARDKIVSAIYIASIVRWLRMDSPRSIKTRIYKTVTNLKFQDVILPPIYRKYRENIRAEGRVAKGTTKKKNCVILTLSDAEGITESTLERGARYISLFKPHCTTPSEHSKLVGALEKLDDATREKWLKDFVAASIDKQKSMILKHLGRA